MLTVTVPAETDALTTLAAVKGSLDITTTTDDAFLSDLIDRASAAIAGYCERTFAAETVSETIRTERCRGDLSLSRWPVTVITSVVEEGTTLATEDYDADLGAGILSRRANGRPAWWRCGSVVVTYTAGFVLPGSDNPTLPADIEAACLTLVERAYHARGRDTGLKQTTVAGIGEFVYFATSEPFTITEDLAARLDRYRVPVFA